MPENNNKALRTIIQVITILVLTGTIIYNTAISSYKAGEAHKVAIENKGEIAELKEYFIRIDEKLIRVDENVERMLSEYKTLRQERIK